jgi:hypothetical protein
MAANDWEEAVATHDLDVVAVFRELDVSQVN